MGTETLSRNYHSVDRIERANTSITLDGPWKSIKSRSSETLSTTTIYILVTFCMSNERTAKGVGQKKIKRSFFFSHCQANAHITIHKFIRNENKVDTSYFTISCACWIKKMHWRQVHQILFFWSAWNASSAAKENSIGGCHLFCNILSKFKLVRQCRV